MSISVDFPDDELLKVYSNTEIFYLQYLTDVENIFDEVMIQAISHSILYL